MYKLNLEPNPCPSCNKKDVELREESIFFYVKCYTCNLEGPVTFDRNSAIFWWNLGYRVKELEHFTEINI